MRRVHRGALAMGILFLIAGAAFFLDAVDWWQIRPRYLAPMLLIGGGLAVLATGFASSER